MGARANKAPITLRLAELLLGALIFCGCLALVAIPLGWLWLVSHLDRSYVTIYLLALIGCPALTIAWGMGLVRLNRVYLRVGGAPVLEAGITIAVLLAALMLAAWLLLAEGGGPMQGPWPG
jgi:hypothetical protein